MASNKEMIESLEAGLGGLQAGVNRMKLGVVDKIGLGIGYTMAGAIGVSCMQLEIDDNGVSMGESKDATWESTAELRERFQHMDLEDKDPVKKGGIDKPPRYFHHLPKPNL
ncbi:hypothetical protein JRO89_XS05G0131600 [Xanthoceras sorbifolium]|uniref:Uncharacterized protein n=1 Tax=Xanthoceras sorbifolium TaxID=99658 RepID=A0ABQ8I2A4_9ROSI|nr:hypothetical protein JRO89_XS05G0131600 [Xanthoceras sorbifolium]